MLWFPHFADEKAEAVGADVAPQVSKEWPVDWGLGSGLTLSGLCPQ